MNLRFKKIVFNILKGIVALVLFAFLIIAIALNLVFTSEKITPKIVEAINKKLDAELQVDGIELYFFSSFPNFSLELDNGVILNGNNSKNDSLIAFKTASVTVNPTAFLLNKKIVINHLIFKQPHIYAFVNKEGVPNWDILKEEVEKDTISRKTEQNSFDVDIEFDDVTISGGNLYFEDENEGIYASLNGLNMELYAAFNPDNILLDIDFDTRKTTFLKKRDTIINDMSFGIIGEIDINRESNVIDLNQTKVIINDVELLADGQLVRNKEKNEVDVLLDLDLEVPSLKTIVELIPEKFLKKEKELTYNGSVILDANVNGIYGNGKFPVIRANLEIKDGSFGFRSMPNKIDLIETNMNLFVDISKDSLSNLNISKFNIKGKGIDLKINGEIADALGNSKISGMMVGSVDFAKIAKIIPLKQNLKLNGFLDADIKGSFLPKDIANKNYGKINALGKLSLSDIHFSYKIDSLIFESKQSDFTFFKNEKSKLLTVEDSEVLAGRINITKSKITIANKLVASADSLFFEFGTTPLKDKKQIATLTSDLRIDNVNFNIGDSIKGMIKKGNAQIKLEPSANDESIPSIHSEFSIDSTGIKAKGRFFAITNGDYNLDLILKDKGNWSPTGEITFNKLYAFTPGFPILLKMPQTKINLNSGIIELDHAKIEIGRSDLEVSGKVFELGNTILNDSVFKAELDVTSNLIDLNELIKTLNEGEVSDESDLESQITNSKEKNIEKATKPKSFILPKGIDFSFESTISRVLFGKLIVDDVQGLISIKDQTIHLENLQMKTMQAKMATRVKLTAKEKNKTSLGFDFTLSDIDLSKLVELMPVLDSLMPMTRSLKGNVNFRIKGISELNDNLGMVAPSLDAIARIEGDDMIVFDSETFTQLSKKLRFKNTEENIIDHVSVEILIQDKTVEILPALITIDRYQFAVGGKYNLDKTYQYQISILKSPLPFKAGVDLIGDDDDFDIKLTKAKFKYLFSDKERHKRKADSTILKRKLDILQKLPF